MKARYFFLFIALFYLGCNNTQPQFKSPVGYDLNNPEKFTMPNILNEISGIAFTSNNNDTIYAEQDEDGKLFHFKLGDNAIVTAKFGKKGDYEDLAICNNKVFMLRSDGVVFSFALAETANKDINNVKEWKGLLPEGEYEGMYADEKNNALYVLCKHCGDSKETNGYTFTVTNDSIAASGTFSIDGKSIAELLGDKKIKFHPSALTKNTLTNEWFILSSVNKLLVTTDSNWKVTTVYPLNPKVFNQPEGIAFDNANNLFISNEGGDIGAGTILKFKLKK